MLRHAGIQVRYNSWYINTWLSPLCPSRKSVRDCLPSKHIWCCCAAVSGMLLLALVAPMLLAYILHCSAVLYLSALCIKYLLFWRCIRLKGASLDYQASLTPPLVLTEPELPFYTIMIALYDEAMVISQLIRNLRALDYPAHKLQILFVLEYDDLYTFNALQPHIKSEQWYIIVVPPHFPRTKASACNYALQYVTGELLVVYDAEDMPDPQQLRKVAWMYRNHSSNVACVQCKLQYYNADENWLTRMFAIEYSILFTYMLPWLAACQLPITLGGSSNHFRTAILKAINGWDGYNVTEDADIGIFLGVAGYKILIADSYTLEESPLSISAWGKQRARWLKGYVLTYFVHANKVLPLPNKCFLHYWLGLSSFSLLFTPIILGLWFILICHPNFNMPSAWWYSAGGTLLCMYCLGNWLQGWYVQRYDPKLSGIRWWWLFYPVYGVLHIWAAVLTLIQLMQKPYHWDKTAHGKSRFCTVEELPP